MSHNSILNNPLDAGTGVDESIEGVNQRLDEIGALLQSQLAQEGVTDLDDSRYNPTPFEYAAIPPSGGELALPYGRTRFDFERGVVKNEHVGEIGTIRDFEDMSQGIESRIQSLRSLFLYADVVCKVRLDDGDWFKLDSCQYVPLKSQGFTQFDIKCKIPFTLYGAASTRSQVFADTDSIAAHMTRQGELGLDTHDSWTTVPWTPHGLYHDYGMDFAKGGLHTISFSRNTLTVENDSGNGNAIDARVLGAATHKKNWHEITRATGISDGDHHIFHVEQAHHLLLLQVRNATDGNSVSVYTEMTGAAP